jgi:hypothetical protein
MQGVFINRLSSPHHWDDGGGGVHLKSAKLASPRIADAPDICWGTGGNQRISASWAETKGVTTSATLHLVSSWQFDALSTQLFPRGYAVKYL